MAFPEDSQLTSGMMEDTELDDGFVQVREQLGNSNEKTRRLGDSDATGNCVSFTDQLETNSGPGIREPSDMDWSGNSGQSNLNVERATSYRLSKDRESDQYEILRKKLEQIEEDISKHTDPPGQLIEERARVVRRLQWCKSRMNLQKGNHDRPSIARNLYTTRPEEEDHLIGLWKCKVKTELDKDKRQALARVFDIEASLIEGSADPGLKLLEQIEKKDCQGCNWEAFAEALTDCGCLKALDTFLKHYKRSPPAPVNHNPVSFQHMVAHVEGMLNTSDALQIATCFGFNVRDIEETEKQGSRYVMKLLRDKGKFDFRNVTLFREALKQLDLIQAANRVGLYEDHLKLPVLKVTLNEATSSVESRKYFDDVTTALTDEIERMADKEPTAKLMHHFEGTYDMPLEDIGKGSIILSLRVKTKNSLERLKSDVKSGKFSKECSKILFPNADNLYGIKDELCLLETYAVGEFERVYQELERMESGKYKKEVSDFTSTTSRSEIIEKIATCITPSQPHDDHTSVQVLNDAPNDDGIVLSLRVKNRTSLDQLLGDVGSGEFSDQLSKLLFPCEDPRSHEIKLVANYERNQIHLVRKQLEKLGCVREESCSEHGGDYTTPIPTTKNCKLISKTNIGSDLLMINKTFVPNDAVKKILYMGHSGEEVSFVGPVLYYNVNKFHNFVTLFDFASNTLYFEIDVPNVPNYVYTVRFSSTSLHGLRIIIENMCAPWDTVEAERCINYGLTNAATWAHVRYTADGQEHLSVVKYEPVRLEIPVHHSPSISSNTVIPKDTIQCSQDNAREYVDKLSYSMTSLPEASINECILHGKHWVPSIDDRFNPRIKIGEEPMRRLMSSFHDLYPINGINRVPAIPQIHYKIKTNHRHSDRVKKITMSFPMSDGELKKSILLSGEQKCSLLQKRNSNRHLTKIADALQCWAEDMQLEMFILTNYKYQNYLKKIRSFITGQNGEYDILVISKEIGILFIKVSSCRGNSTKTIKQRILMTHRTLMKNKYVFLESNRDLINCVSKVPLYQFSVFPYISQKVLNQYLCESHRNSIIPKECCENSEIPIWLNERVTIPSVPCMSIEHYQYLCIRYAGDTSSVNVRTITDGIIDTAKQLANSFLTSEQRNVVKNDASHQVLAGDYGTGKSICLFLRARHHLQENKENKVCHIICSDIEPEFFSSSNEDEGQTTCKHSFIETDKDKIDDWSSRVSTLVFQPCGSRVVSIKSASSNLIATLKSIYVHDKKTHVFLHEVPLAYFENVPSLLCDLRECMPGNTNLWISVVTHSLRDVNTVENNSVTSFHFDRFQNYMRMPARVITLYTTLQKYLGISHGDITKVGHVVDGPDPTIYFLRDCDCPVNVLELNQSPLLCHCIENRILAVLGENWKTLKGISYNSIAFYIHCHLRRGKICDNIYTLLQKVTSAMDLPIKWWDELTSQTEDCIVVTNEFRVLTEGKSVIISFDPFAMKHWKPGINRKDPHIPILAKCLSQYVHISWPRDEATMFHEIELNEWDECLSQKLQSNDDTTDSDGNMKRRSNIKTLRQSDTDCLDYLLSVGVISPR
ncbi:uncharacterized protein [Apostichopus japonicus]|uniref:uncharacterized protein isoform X2 n=1 Tax=Stichopus japonicus TaxID=307972 RepID=UPI003AB3202E